jgi:hypothetical protein
VKLKEKWHFTADALMPRRSPRRADPHRSLREELIGRAAPVDGRRGTEGKFLIVLGLTPSSRRVASERKRSPTEVRARPPINRLVQELGRGDRRGYATSLDAGSRPREVERSQVNPSIRAVDSPADRALPEAWRRCPRGLSVGAETTEPWVSTTL